MTDTVSVRAWLPLGATLFLASMLTGLGPAAVSAAQPARLPIRWRVSTLTVQAGAASSYAEPGIVFGPTGSALADAASANTSAPPTFWISHDGGGSWAVGQDFDGSGASTGDADTEIGSDGYLYALNLGFANPPAQPTNPTVLVYRSTDGSRWLGPASFPAPHGQDQPDRPWLAVDPRHPAEVEVLNSEGGGNIVAWRSADHGATFSGPFTVTGGANSQAALALSSRPLFDPTRDRRVYMLYESAGPDGLTDSGQATVPPYEFPLTQIWMAVSGDGGMNWTNRLVLDTANQPGPMHGGTLAHLLVASSIDSAGTLYAAFSLRPKTGTETHIYLLHSPDPGVSWSSPVRVDAGTPSNVMPALAATPGGTVFLSWYASSAPDFRSPKAEWVEMFALSADPRSARPMFVPSQVSGSPLHVGAIDTAGAIASDLGANWGLRDFQSIGVDLSGRPHLVWAVDNGKQATQTAVPEDLSIKNISQRGDSHLPNTAMSEGIGRKLLVLLVGVAGAGLQARQMRRRSSHGAEPK